MIRENQRLFNLILVLIDALLISFSLVLAWYIRFKTDLLGLGVGTWGFEHYMASLLFILPVYIIIYDFFDLYSPQRTQKTIKSEAFNIIKANLVGLLLLVAILFLFELLDYSRYMMIMFVILNIIFAITERWILRKFLKYIRSIGYNTKYIIIIGAGNVGKKVSQVINQNEYLGYKIIGFLDDNKKVGDKVNGSKVIGAVGDLEIIISNELTDRVILTSSPPNDEIMEWVINTCEKCGVRAEVVPDYYAYASSKPHIAVIEDIPLIQIRHVPLDNHFNQFIKRFLDLLLVIPAIVILSPLFFVTAVIVKISSPGSIIFKQERVGRNKQTFNMYKFRSMRVQDGGKEKFIWTTKNDPRVTKFGSFIRKTSIDELPQFFNILRGEMSLIGPRPERSNLVKNFKEEIPKYMIKHHVRPGMTGWAQVNGYRGNTSLIKRIEYDIYYVENWTLSMDIDIFFRTLINLFHDKNAY